MYAVTAIAMVSFTPLEAAGQKKKSQTTQSEKSISSKSTSKSKNDSKTGTSQFSTKKKESTATTSKSNKDSKKEETAVSSAKSKGSTSKSASSKDEKPAKSVKSAKKDTTKETAKESDTKGAKDKNGKSTKASTAAKAKNDKTPEKTATTNKKDTSKGTTTKKNSAEVSDKSTRQTNTKSATNTNSKSTSPKNDTSKNNKTDATSKSNTQKNTSKSETIASRDEYGNSVRRRQSTSESEKKEETIATPQRNKTNQNKEKSSSDSLTTAINKHILSAVPKNQRSDAMKVNNVKTDDRKKTVSVGLDDSFTTLPVSKDFIHDLEKAVGKALPDDMSSYRVNLNVGDRPLSYYIAKIDKLPVQNRQNEPFVVARDPYVKATKGMEGDIVAMWHSHGRYYKGSSGWQWQRPFLFETAEDVFTMGYVLPYIVPMLENAGAYVMLPRERDPNKNEVIVDNDINPGGELYSQPYYKEETGQNRWEEGEKEGFIYDLKEFRDTENPFEGGTYRQTKTVKGGKLSKAGWYADIPEDGEYAVYVSYKTLPNSTEDAHYTVNYSGGSREFIVNQTMGGGTWIYLGTFPLEAGYSDTEPVVTLTNATEKAAGKIVTADAVKIGGGMGNIARSASRSDVYKDPSTPDNKTSVSAMNSAAGIDDEDEFDGAGQQAEADVPAQTSKKGSSAKFSTSGMPRFVEGARYWMQWAGIPESVYSPFHGKDDYKDDYTGRGHWVNYLAGGSRVLPNKPGLNIPVDIAMALHSDAGKRNDDSVVGTLGIYYTNGGGKYADGTSRMNSRMLTDLIMRQITGDVRAELEPNWTRRSMWDKSYLEARVPEVPTTLIELLSHQNFGDMKYGMDPNFRFTVGRAIYKGMARFMAERKGRELVIQPLPVNDFAIQRTGKSRYKLSWEPTPDPLEPTAMPTKYIIFERTDGNLGFRKIAEVKGTTFELKVTDHEVHSFKIVAANAGGLSFPSEVLALRESPDGSTPALIINGFTRISSPGIMVENGKAGFDSEDDFGVPYIRDISFTGHQNEFRRSSGNSFGQSNRNYVTEVVAGNTFDFVAEHGLSLGEAGMGFVSASLKAIETGKVKLSNYSLVDLILGKQKTTQVGKVHAPQFKTFPVELQNKLKGYLDNGGHLLVSGAYVVSDLLNERSTQADRDFANNVLGVDLAESKRHNGRLTAKGALTGQYTYSNTLNDKQYIVEKPDALRATHSGTVVLEYGDDHAAAAVASKYGKGSVVVMSVPFESVQDEDHRDKLMKDLLKYLRK